MALELVTHVERPDLLIRWNAVAADVWPELMLHDAAVEQHWGGLTRHFPWSQLYLLDDDADELVGVGNTVPLAWDGTADGLPSGLDGVLVTAIGHREVQPAATALCALQAAVLPGHQRRGLSRVVIAGMRDVAARLGLPDLIAPVRPNQKTLYPLTPIERYIQWRRPDGLPFDAWLRAHVRLGAEILRVAERSMTISGTVAEWESWTGLALPDSGEYVMAGALTPVTVDRAQDIGLYVEPNVWMRHRLSR